MFHRRHNQFLAHRRYFLLSSRRDVLEVPAFLDVIVITIWYVLARTIRFGQAMATGHALALKQYIVYVGDRQFPPPNHLRESNVPS